MKDKDSFVLFRSFFQAIEEQPPDAFKKIVLSVAAYALDGVNPNLNDITLKMVFNFVKPIIDSSNKRWEETRIQRSEAGKLGGAPLGNQNAAKNKGSGDPTGNQNASKPDEEPEEPEPEASGEEAKNKQNQAKQPNACKNKQNQAKQAVNVNVSVPVSGSVNESVPVSVNADANASANGKEDAKEEGKTHADKIGGDGVAFEDSLFQEIKDLFIQHNKQFKSNQKEDQAIMTLIAKTKQQAPDNIKNFIIKKIQQFIDLRETKTIDAEQPLSPSILIKFQGW